MTLTYLIIGTMLVFLGGYQFAKYLVSRQFKTLAVSLGLLTFGIYYLVTMIGIVINDFT